MEHYQLGTKQLQQMLGPERARTVIDRFRALNPEFEKEAVSVIIGRTWSREALDRKNRSLCSIGILAGPGRADSLRIVFELAIKNGATLDEITEVLLQVGIYAGYPAAFDALAILEGVQDALRTEGAV